MFSGIVEAKAKLIEFRADDPNEPQSAVLTIEKPSHFNDISLGDSVAVNGVCLTVEHLTTDTMQFSLGFETLRLTQWSDEKLRSQEMNLERSMKWNERIHGHIVTGHVDGTLVLKQFESKGTSSILIFTELDPTLQRLIWKKGSLCINGVSLTVNEVSNNEVSVCLIPETLKRTNLSDLVPGDRVNVEVDQMARGIAHMLTFQTERLNRELHL